MAGCRALSEVEIYQILSAMKTRRNKFLFILGIRTGFRISELLKLKVSDVYRDGQPLDRIRVQRRFLKEKRGSREIPLHPQAQAMIKDYVRSLEPGTQELFPSRAGGALTRFTAHKIFKDAFKAAGIKGPVATHSMRKTFARKVYNALGKDLVATSQALGHAHISTTIDYIDVNQKDIERAILE